MSANNAFHVAVLAGDGIGPEVMAPALEVLRKIEATSDLQFRFTEAPAGANHYRATGKSMPESTFRLGEEADFMPACARRGSSWACRARSSAPSSAASISS